MFYQTSTTRRPLKGLKKAVFVPGDLDIQTCPSKGPNMSSLLIWCKSVQWFPEIFHTETKKSQRQKQNLAQFTECSNNTNIA